jgi:hypothetical protein
VDFARTFENEPVYLPDLTRTYAIIRSVRFKGCRIEGPAIIPIAGGSKYVGTLNYLIRPGMDADVREHPEWFFWVLPDDQPYAVGLIGLEDCLFEDCTFDGVAWAGYLRHRQWWIDSISIGRWDAELAE